MENRKLLLIDDDPSIHQVFTTVGYEVGLHLEVAAEGQVGLDLGLAGEYELVVLDLGLPDVSGISVLKKLREARPLLPIILLTSRSSEMEKVIGLEVGADDYLTKPFSVAELIARITALLRRKKAYTDVPDTKSSDSFAAQTFGRLTIEPKRRMITVDGNPIELTALEYDIIAYLILHKDQIVTREQLLIDVWGYVPAANSTYDSTVSTHISRVRTKIEPTPDKPRYILTIRGVGYRFAECEEAA